MKKLNDNMLEAGMRLLRFRAVLIFLALIVPCMSVNADAAIHDRVVAFVDDQAITQSEFREQYKISSGRSSSITMKEVLNTMINRVIMLKEAKKYRIEAASSDEILKEYIDLKIRAFVRVSDADIEKFYQENISKFAGKEYEDVRDEIDLYLTERLINERLMESLQELRKKSYIKILDGSLQ